jgi:hypothetical protein
MFFIAINTDGTLFDFAGDTRLFARFLSGGLGWG